MANNKLFYAFGSGLRNKTTTYNTSHTTSSAASRTTYWNTLVSSANTYRGTSHTTSKSTLVSSATTSKTTYRNTSYSTLTGSGTSYHTTSYSTIWGAGLVCSSSISIKNTIIGYYKSYLKRCADSAGLTYWYNNYLNGQTLTDIRSLISGAAAGAAPLNSEYCGSSAATFYNYNYCSKTTSKSTGVTAYTYRTTSYNTYYTTSYPTYVYRTTYYSTNYNTTYPTYVYRTTDRITNWTTSFGTTYNTSHITSQV